LSHATPPDNALDFFAATLVSAYRNIRQAAQRGQGGTDGEREERRIERRDTTQHFARPSGVVATEGSGGFEAVYDASGANLRVSEEHNMNRSTLVHAKVPLANLFTRALPLLIAGALVTACAGYVPGRQSYWDEKIREMCANDGGVLIYRKMPISKADFDRLGRVGAHVAIPPRPLSRTTDLVVADESTTVLRDANPRVWRSEQLVKRTSDGAVLAKVVRYSRVGGDIPSPSHSSHFGCPDEKAVLAAQQAIFLVKEARE
jgi:hypothetical protein